MSDPIMDLDPRDYRVHTPYAGDLEPVRTDLVRAVGQQYTEHGEQRNISEKYVPRQVFNTYIRMNAAFMTEHRERHASPLGIRSTLLPAGPPMTSGTSTDRHPATT